MRSISEEKKGKIYKGKRDQCFSGKGLVEEFFISVIFSF
jgi:hypothetical protein